LDEINIFRSALTADQVKLLYNQGQGTVFGALSTASDNSPSNSSTDSYCPPGQGTACVGPVTEWKFDEKTGTAPNDTSGNGRTGSFSSTPQWKASCKHGACLYFDGSNDGVFNNNAVVSAYPFTLQAWVKGTPSTFQKTVISLADKDSTNIVYAIGTDSSGDCRIYSGNGSLAVATSCNYTTNDGQWHLLTTVFTSNTSRTMYVDGKFDQTDTTSVTFNSAVDRISVGHSGESNDAGFYPGQIDEARVYNYARTPAQIAWDYNQGGPVGWWKLDENQTGDGQTVYDSSGNGNNSTTEGGTGNLDCTVTGKRNTACDFDGSDDYINTSTDNFFDIGSDLTISAWVNRSSFTTPDVVLAKDNDYSTSSDGGYVLSVGSSDNVKFDVSNTIGSTCSANSSSTSTLITSAGWHHLVGVFEINDGNPSRCWLYIDGKPVTPQVSAYMTTASIPNALNLVIGAETDGGNPFDGIIDDVKIFNYALTSEQVKTEYNDGSVNFGD